MEVESANEQMIRYLEDKIEDQAITIFDLRTDLSIVKLEIKILTDVIRDLENELRAAQ
jgi:hypothetical protein